LAACKRHMIANYQRPTANARLDRPVFETVSAIFKPAARVSCPSTCLVKGLHHRVMSSQALGI
jgi:hypothetical protein